METKAGSEPSVAGIAGRLRAVLLNRPGALGDKLSKLAGQLGVSVSQLEKLLVGRRKLLDAALLIDVVAMAVRDCGVDPHWLLTGEYDLATHRCALVLLEEGSSRSTVDSQLRSFVERHWRSQRMSLITPPKFSGASLISAA